MRDQVKLHPFPARMAPSIALGALASIPPKSTILDPMCGSGTVLHEASRNGHNAIGFDVDPLAVLMAKVRDQSFDAKELLSSSQRLVDRASKLDPDTTNLPWMDDDPETREFVEYWFAPSQRKALRALACVLTRYRGPTAGALRLALSKIIITKEPKASLARDTSHSRPHRVQMESQYDVTQGFLLAASQIARALDRDPASGEVAVHRRDARRLPSKLVGQVDMVVTSPPYGNSIDYMRGHRLALVWLGHSIPQLRDIRGNGVGTERTLRRARRAAGVKDLVKYFGPIDDLDPRSKSRLDRFAWDIWTVLKQMYIALRPDGQAVIVSGNSTKGSVFLNNTEMIAAAARRVGFKEESRYTREIPPNHRYLPPPGSDPSSSLSKRVLDEVVLSFRKG